MSTDNANKPTSPITYYGFSLSGHSHRVELFLSLLGLPYTVVNVDLPNREQKLPAHMALHPFGQVPVIDDNGTVVWDSSAILIYLASKYGEGAWLPEDPIGRSEVQRWLSVAAGPLANGPSLARVANVFKRACDMDAAHTVARNLLLVLDSQLAGRDYLATQGLTIADVAMYTYIAHAPEGGIDLAPYANVTAWLARIEALPRFIAMPRSKTGLWAA